MPAGRQRASTSSVAEVARANYGTPQISCSSDAYALADGVDIASVSHNEREFLQLRECRALRAGLFEGSRFTRHIAKRGS